jgi:hypothetical protein
MARTGLFGGFYFDPEVFASYMAELPTWNNKIIASGILQEDATIMDKIGSEGNVATLPFYAPLDVNSYLPYNNDGLTDNTPREISGNKQTAMLIQRMAAWKEQDFTKELTGADPLQHVAKSINDYYQQVWERELMNIVNATMKLSGLSNHVTDISGETGDAGKVDETTLIYAKQKALGDAASNFGMIYMHSMIYAKYQALKLVEYSKFNSEALGGEVTLPTIDGLVVEVTDRHTVDTTGETPKYITSIVGRGAVLTATKGNYENPYYTDYDPETRAGIQKLYTKQGRVLHPNGLSLNVANIATESPTFAELGTTANWSLAFDEKNVRIGQIISNG